MSSESPLWDFENGVILTECDSCPCTPTPVLTPCCTNPATSDTRVIPRIWIWVCNAIATGGLPLPFPQCAPFTCDTTTIFLSEQWSRTFPWNVTTSPTPSNPVLGLAGCYKLYVTYGCDEDGEFRADAWLDESGISSGYQFKCPNLGSTIPGTKCRFIPACRRSTFTDPTNGHESPDTTTLFVSDYDPIDGVHAPNSSDVPRPDDPSTYTVVPIDLLFSVTLTFNGVPTLYTAILRFAPAQGNLPLVPSFHGFCYNWQGLMVDCDGVCQPVQLWWDDNASTWNLWTFDGNGSSLIELYSGSDFPTAGTSILPTSYGKCDNSGQPSPWTLGP